MPDWSSLRRRARSRHSHLCVRLGVSPLQLPAAEDLLRAAADETEFDAYPLPPQDGLLSGAHAVLDRASGCIWYAAGDAVPPMRHRFARAHEYAHLWLHPEIEADSCFCEDSPEDFSAPVVGVPGAQVAEGYSSRERRELEANLFAAELLLPGPTLRQLVISEGWSASQIVARSGLSETCVLAQLAQALLSPESNEVPAPAEANALDPDQQAAASAEQCPLLVDAGPGTGKTSTLISRLRHLIHQNVAPENILALTYSNLAAEEIRSRLGRSVGELADRVWISTFHSFGYEILRKEGAAFGLSSNPRLIDVTDAVALLEHNLDRLHLQEFETLSYPSAAFPDILRCISRAKDELIGPEYYLHLALAQISQAGNDAEDLRLAHKSQEIAGIYAVYQQLLDESGLLDFGDLLMRSVQIFTDQPTIRERWQARYLHIVIDEYQDINRASALLVQALAGKGAGLWVVGDIRQAIYRFRGASPASLHAFATDFPSARRLPLTSNYRSVPALVSLFSETAKRMAGVDSVLWHSHRLDGTHPAILSAEADDEESQMDGIAATIRSFQEQGVPLGSQAVLCHTNRQTVEVADQLRRRGLTVHQLGVLWEREEIKEMLALLSFVTEPIGTALLRLAKSAPRFLPTEVVVDLLQAARAETLNFPEALNWAIDTQVLSVKSRKALRQLYKDLKPLFHVQDVWRLFARLLFETQRFRPLLADGSPEAAQKRLAMLQLLRIAQIQPRRLQWNPNEDSRAGLLAYIRRVLATGQERTQRGPMDTPGVEAVRVMTIHQAKGLEFTTVYLPNLSQGLFPPRKGSSQAKPPPNLTDQSEKSEENSEQEALFFVALSRARDHLVLSRPVAIKDKPAAPCSALASLQPSLDHLNVRPVRWSHRPARRVETGRDQQPIAFIPAKHDINETRPPTAAALEQYQKCPRRYYYRHVLHLEELNAEATYLRFYQTLLRTVLPAESESPASTEPQEQTDQFLMAWDDKGACSETAYGRVLRERAPRMIRNAHRLSLSDTEEERPERILAEHELTVRLEAGSVRVTCDRVEELQDGTLRLVDLSLKRPNGSEHLDPRLALIRLAAAQSYPEKKIQIAIDHLFTGERQRVKHDRRYEPDRVLKYNAALADIQAGQFAPNPSPRHCAHCPFLFICPS